MVASERHVFDAMVSVHSFPRMPAWSDNSEHEL